MVEGRLIFAMDKARIGMVLGASMPLLAAIAQPSYAADPCRTGMPTAYTYAEISTSGFSCKLGDTIYSDFSFTGFTTGSFIFTNPSPYSFLHTFQGQSLAFGPASTANYSYKVALDPGSPPNTFWKFETSTTVNTILSGVASTKTLEDTAIPSSTVTSTNGMNSGMYVYSPFNAGPISFRSNINVTQGLMTQFTDVLLQADVPGPLPLLGATAAFGFSRHLRRRLAKSS